MIIIKTKYLSPTNTKGSRIKAEANGFTVTIPFPYGQDAGQEKTYYEAVKALVKKHQLDWDISNMGYGSDNQGYYFTFSSSVISE